MAGLVLEDGMYWMPLSNEEEKLTTSLFYEDKLLLDTHKALRGR